MRAAEPRGEAEVQHQEVSSSSSPGRGRDVHIPAEGERVEL